MTATDTTIPLPFTVTSSLGERVWHADDAEDAAAQHRDSFPDEYILAVTAPWDLDTLETTARNATQGPWRWDGHRVPTLHGTGGEAGVYMYETEVIEADHDGGCGCRRDCHLELAIREEDRAHIAAMNPQTTLALIDQIRTLQARVAELEMTDAQH